MSPDGVTTETTIEATAPEPETTEVDSWPTRIVTRMRSGDLGSWPVIIALGIIVLVFSQTAQNFFTPGNFTNLITQMAGTCLLAYGVVFVLLIGEIDLSIAFVSGVAGVVVAKAQLPTGPNLPWYVCVLLALLATTAIGAFQGSFVALIGVPSFVVTLAGFEIWQGVIQRTVPGVIVIQDNTINDFSNYFFSDLGGWIIAALVSGAYVFGMIGTAISNRRHGIPLRDPIVFVLKLLVVPVISILTVYILNKDRGVPFALLLVVGGSTREPTSDSPQTRSDRCAPPEAERENRPRVRLRAGVLVPGVELLGRVRSRRSLRASASGWGKPGRARRGGRLGATGTVVLQEAQEIGRSGGALGFAGVAVGPGVAGGVAVHEAGQV